MGLDKDFLAFFSLVYAAMVMSLRTKDFESMLGDTSSLGRSVLAIIKNLFEIPKLDKLENIVIVFVISVQRCRWRQQ